MTVEGHLEDQIRKAFHVYLNEIRNILQVLSSEATRQDLYTLVNQTDQLLCCQRVKLEDTPLSAFPDLSSRLSYKISTQIETKVEKLCNAIRQVEACHSKILTQHNLVTEQLQQQPLSVEIAAQSMASRPSVSQLIEWLGDLEQDAFYILVEKRHLVNQLNLRSGDTVRRLQNTWQANHGLQDKVTHVEAYLQLFMEEPS